MFVDIDAVPAGKRLFTVHVTLGPNGTPRSEMSTDEVDVIAPARSDHEQVLEAGVENDGGANAGFYIAQTYGETARVVGIVNQSDGYVMWDSFRPGGDETGEDDL